MFFQKKYDKATLWLTHSPIQILDSLGTSRNLTTKNNMLKLKVLVTIIQEKSEKSKLLLFFEMAAVKDAVSNTCLVNILSSKV